VSDTDSPNVYTINDFCRVERISRSLLYQLWQHGKGPRYFLAGSHRRITEQARQDWHRDREAETAMAAEHGK
jgi:hypothetical protein